MPHPVLDAVLSAGARNFVLHFRLVAPKKPEIVTEDPKILDFQLALRGSPQGLRCFPEPVKEDIVQTRDRRKRMNSPDSAEGPPVEPEFPFHIGLCPSCPTLPKTERGNQSRGYVCTHDSRVCNSLCKFPVTCRS